MKEQFDINEMHGFEELLGTINLLLSDGKPKERTSETLASVPDSFATNPPRPKQYSREVIQADQELAEQLYIQRLRNHYIEPLLDLVQGLFNQLFQVDIKLENSSYNHHLECNSDIVTFIRFSGPQQGIIAVSYPVRTALSVVSLLYRQEKVVVDDDVFDAIAEIVNIMAGKAQPVFSSLTGERIEMTLPRILRGCSFAHTFKDSHGWLTFRFTSDLGSFRVYTSVR